MRMGMGRDRLTGLSQCLIIEPRLAHLERMPFVSLEDFVDVDDIEMFILSQYHHSQSIN